MIEEIEGLPEGVVGIRADGEVSREDYDTVLTPLVERALAEHGAVRCLYVLGDEFERFTLGAMWEDGKMGVEHLRSWEKLACVSDSSWIAHGVKAFGWMRPGAVKVFPAAEIEAAKEWVAS